jgi:hypothetical protein
VRKLFTQGTGLIDAHRIASLIIVETPTAAWTDDEGLTTVSEQLSFLAKPPFPAKPSPK